MREYAPVTLNMIEYAGIYLEKQSAEYAIILNVCNEVHSISHSTNYWAVIETETYSRQSALQKEKCLNAGA